jgi:hypothetical protein
MLNNILNLVGPTNLAWWALKPCPLSSTQYRISQFVHFKTGQDRVQLNTFTFLKFCFLRKKFAEHRCRAVLYCRQVCGRYYLFTANLFPLRKRLGVGEGRRGNKQCSCSRSSCPSWAIDPCTPIRYSHVRGGTPYVGVLAPKYDPEDIEREGITGITVHPLTCI